MRPRLSPARRSLLPLLTLAVLTGCSAWKHNKCLSGPASRYEISEKERKLGTGYPDHDPSDVVVRSLGAGGVYVVWQGNGVIVSPSFTKYPGGVANTPVEPDPDAIAEGLQGVDKEQVQAVLVGSSRYDRLADIVEVARRLPNADVYVNQTGKHMLAPYVEQLKQRKATGNKKPRIRSVNGKDHPRLSSQWADVRGTSGAALPIRVRAIALPSDDVDTLDTDAEYEWDEFKLGEFVEGKRHAYAIELTDAGKIVFRILVVESGTGLTKIGDLNAVAGDEHPDELGGDPDEFGDDEEDEQDWSMEDIDAELEAEEAAAAGGGEAAAPRKEGRTKGVDEFDLVAITVRGHLYDEADPTALYQTAKAGHVMLIDYEDNTKAGAKKLRFAKEVTGKDAAGMICTTERALGHAPWERGHPRTGGIDGLRSKTLTMPLPGEWMLFQTKPDPVPEPKPEPEKKAEEGKGDKKKAGKKKAGKKKAKKKQEEPPPEDDDDAVIIEDD